MKLSKVQLTKSSDPNAVGSMGASLSSCVLEVGRNCATLQVSADGNWIEVNGDRIVPRELVLHALKAAPLAEQDVLREATNGIVTCEKCGETFASRQALGGHRRHCSGAES